MSTERVFYYFNEISKISRVSFEEKKIADYLVEQGKRMGLEVIRDKENNVIIKKISNRIDSPVVILQAHTDMVWKSENSEETQEKIPYHIHVKDGRICTNGTTLGADDGIGVALMLTLLENNTKEYPSLEAIFTANEEETMSGAIAIRKEDVTGEYMINLDSEKEGVFTIGSAGGISSFCKLPVQSKASIKKKTVKIMVMGCIGGHSGLEINRKHENSIKLLVRFLRKLSKNSFELKSLEGGSRSNAIPEWATAVVNTDDIEILEKEIMDFIKNCQNEWCNEEKELSISIKPTEYSCVVYDDQFREKLLLLLENLPHGVYSRTEDFVCSSANLAIVREIEKYITIELTLRSSYESWHKDEVQKIERLMEHFGGESERKDVYPAWMYKKDSELTKIFLDTYDELYCEKAECENVHAGLECGIIMRNCPSVRDSISIGPTILNAHTVSESLDIESVNKVYVLLDKVLKNINAKKEQSNIRSKKGDYYE